MSKLSEVTYAGRRAEESQERKLHLWVVLGRAAVVLSREVGDGCQLPNRARHRLPTFGSDGQL